MMNLSPFPRHPHLVVSLLVDDDDLAVEVCSAIDAAGGCLPAFDPPSEARVFPVWAPLPGSCWEIERTLRPFADVLVVSEP